ncbi:hypothetical protein GGI20_003265 [Coemansia sp. BCRC 34301]|nr:hypothetical protein GGI20_003265 [Coemansia sp. BCRC 34301]
MDVNEETAILPDRTSRRDDELKGYLLMAASALGFAANSACVKALALSRFPSLEIVFARSILQLALGLLGCLFCQTSPLGPPAQRPLLVARGAAGAFGLACFFYAVTVMTLAQATVVFFTGPVFSALFASYMLAEPYGYFDRTMSVLCLLAIVLVVNPQGSLAKDEVWGAVAALVGAMSGALAYCLVRKAGRAVHSMVHVVYFGALSMVGSGVLMFVVQLPRWPVTSWEWTLMAALGAFSFAGQVLLNRGLQLAPTGPATLMRNLDVVFAFVLGITLFAEMPDLVSIIGAVLIACSDGCGFCGWALRRIVLVYILFVSLFTCPTSPDHFICRSEALVRSTIVTPVHNYLLTTEAGTRVNTAYNAHLVPFYEKHAVPIVDAAYAFAKETAAPALYSATEPVRSSVSRLVEPHREKVAAAYLKYLGPVVDKTTAAVSCAADQWVVPAATKVQSYARCATNYVVPMASSAVNDYIVPFYKDTVHPRWNHQIKPALCRYSKAVLHYTRAKVLPAIGDGASRAYIVSRDFAMAHIVPHAKRATVHTYMFLRTHVSPPIIRLYEQNLRAYVDRVVPWDHVSKVTNAVGRVACGSWAFAKGFAEEFYFMCYTIATGDEHPLVIARLKAEQDTKKATAVEEKERVGEVGQLQGLARKFSGSARQWIQAARGWVGSAASTAMGGVVSYESRMRATVSQQWSQATSAAAVATSAIADELLYTEPIATTPSPQTHIVVEPSADVAPTYTAEKVPVVTVADVVERPHAHVASFVSLDPENLREFIAETPVVPEPEMPATVVVAETVPTPDTLVVIEQAVEPPPVAESVSEPVSELIPIEPVPELTSIDTPVPLVNIAEILEPVAKVIEVPPVDTPESVVSAVEVPLTDTPAPVVNVVEVPSADVPAPVVSVIEMPPADTFAVFETSVAMAPAQKEETTSAIVEQQTTANVATILAEDAASLVYEARDAMAGVLINEDERGVFDELVKSAALGTEKLEEFPSVLNDIDSTTAVAEEAPIVSQTKVPSAAIEETTPVVGLVDEDVRKVASNWVKDARESISKELAQERTRAGSLVDGEADVSLSLVHTEETSAKAPIPETTPEQLLSEPASVSVVASPVQTDEPRKTPTKVTDKLADLPPPPPPPPQHTIAAPPVDVKQQQPSVGEIFESVKRLKKPIADAASDSATPPRGPRKVKKTKKRIVKKSPQGPTSIQGSFKRLVEVGRVVLITHGEDAGKIATIVDIVDHNRAIIDGPTTDVKRQIITYKNVVLTDIVVKRLPRTIGTKALAKFLEKEQVVEAWQKTAWAQKLEARKRRANMSDFDRFKLMRLKKQQRDIVNRQSAVLRKERA